MNTISKYISIFFFLIIVSEGFSLDENYLLQNNKKVYNNLYIDNYDEYRNIKTNIESISYYMTTKLEKNDNSKYLFNSFKGFSNGLGNSYVGLQLNPSLNYSEYQLFKKESKCKKYYFSATDNDKLIYEDRLTNKCFYLIVDDINSLTNIMNAITDYINGDKKSLSDIAIREGVNSQLSKYKYFKQHRDILNLLIDYLKDKLL